MDIASGLALYCIIGLIVLFMVLPIGVRRNDDVNLGEDPGAPAPINVKRKLLITAGISAIIWVLVYLVVDAELYSFRT